MLSGGLAQALRIQGGRAPSAVNVEYLIQLRVRKAVAGFGFRNGRYEGGHDPVPLSRNATLAIVPINVESIMPQSAKSTTNSR